MEDFMQQEGESVLRRSGGVAPADAVRVALATAAAPGCAMLLGSVLLLRLRVSVGTQAVLQHLSAGIILAAVAGELFPLLAEGSRQPGGSLGLTAGFVAGLLLMFGAGQVEQASQSASGAASAAARLGLLGCGAAVADVESRGAAAGPMLLDKDQLKGHLDELAATIVRVDENAARLPPSSHADDDDDEACAALLEAESAAAEAVHDELHRLLRKTQHTRRVLGGSADVLPLAADERAALRARMSDLKVAVLQLSAHCALPSLDPATQLQVAAHIDALDESLASFHKTSAQVLLPHWRRRASGCSSDAALTDDADAAHGRFAGRRLPWATVVPVVVDALMDGFLIGLFCSLSRRAGMVLALATSVEMAFLGAVFASSVWRAARAPAWARIALVVLPPAALVAAAAAGAALGTAASALPALFVAIIAMGTVALLYLVTHELLIEAHEATKDDDGGGGRNSAGPWLFVGVFLVLQLNVLLPLDEGCVGVLCDEGSSSDYDYGRV